MATAMDDDEGALALHSRYGQDTMGTKATTV